MSVITSLQNRRVKTAIKLRKHRQRIKQQRFVIDGLRELRHAWESGVTLTEVFVCEALCDAPAAQRLLRQLQQDGREVLSVTASVWEKLSFGRRREGILAVAAPPVVELNSIATAGQPLIVVLEGVEKPGNVGAVIRTADGAGATAVLIVDGVGDLFNPNVIRASLGTVFRLPVVACSAATALSWLKAQGLAIFVATVGASEVYTQVDWSQPCAVVLGSEAEGVSRAWQGEGLTAVGIPMLGHADSLNVSASASALLYEAQRQRAPTAGRDP